MIKVNNFFLVTEMLKLSLNQLQLIAKDRCIKGYKSLFEDEKFYKTFFMDIESITNEDYDEKNTHACSNKNI